MKPQDFLPENRDPGEYDDEAGMAQSNLETIVRSAQELEKHIGAEENLPEWCQEKLAVVKSMLVTVTDYMASQDSLDHKQDDFAFDTDRIAEQLDSLLEVNPHDFDSDEDYYAALRAPAKTRSSMSRSSYRHPDDPDFMDPDQRRLRADQERVAKAQAEYHAKKKAGVAEGSDDKEPFDYAKWKASNVKPRKPRGYKDAEAIGQQQRKIDKERKEKGVAEGHADQQRRIVKKNGKPVGEVGIDRESSPGVGQWYMKCYAHNIDNSGYDSMEEALEELKHCLTQGVAEGTGNIGAQIKAVYQKIHNQGDDAIEFAYYDSPIFAQYWNEYEGDLDSIIAEVDPSELQIILDELTSAAEDQGISEDGLDDYRQRLHGQGFTDSPEERNADRLERKRRHQEKLDRIHSDFMNHGSTSAGSDLERARVQHEIDVLAHRLRRMERDDDDWERTYDMMRDRINRYQWSSQRDIDPEQLAAISNIKYEPRKKATDYKEVDESGDRAVNDKGLTQHRWLQLVQTKFPDAKIVCAKMIDGPCRATLPDGRTLSWVKAEQGVAEEWSQKYKKSINCSHPRGFSQKAHCAGRKKHNESAELDNVCPDCGFSEQGLLEAKKGLYYYVNKRKKAGTSRPANHPKAPTAQAWKDAAKTAKKESMDYESQVDALLNEFAGGMGAGSVATAPGVGKGPKVGTLFGGSYSPKTPFNKKRKK